MTYRYLSKAALWWPTSREDISVGWLPKRPGKAVQLELKTTTVTGVALHDVLVDLGQLWEYHTRPLGQQPFYAFPRPNWRGNLTAAAKAQERMVTELGYARSGAGWWFADWMILLTTAQVATVLQHDLAAHGSRKRNTKRRLVRFDLSRSTAKPAITWGSGVATPQTIDWLEFWPTLEQCGRDGWPQLIRLPERIMPPQGPYSRPQVEGLLRQAAYMLTTDEWDHNEPLVALEPAEDRNYQILRDAADVFGISPDDGTGRGNDNRLAIFLDAQALFPAER